MRTKVKKEEWKRFSRHLTVVHIGSLIADIIASSGSHTFYVRSRPMSGIVT